MGLLTNPQTREKLVTVIKKFDNRLCVLCYLIGVSWFLALAYRPLNAGTYFSENALLPGLVTPDFKHDHGAADYYNELKNELKSIKEQLEASPFRTKDESILHRLPSSWFERKLRDLGLDAYVQNFTFTYPASILRDQKFPGNNVYGILRAPRAASTEAIVLTVPYRPPGSELDKTGAGLGLLLALAKSFRRHTYWAKDIIFLVTEHENIGMQAWLNAYHYQNTDYLYPGELHGRSGSIQAAVNLELPGDTISKINIKAEGLNGQLPNLDLINTMVKLCRRDGIQSSLQKRNDYWNPESYEGWLHAAKTMGTMMWNLASNTPTGSHGLFHRYHIEAITLQGVKLKNAKRTHSFTDMGRVVESLFRSLNNLLERFHQSFFFYLLPSTDRYVSIGLYMPPAGVMLLPVIIKALALWISYSASQVDGQEQAEKANGDSTGKGEDKEASGTESQEDGDKKAEKLKDEPKKQTSSWLNLVPPVVMAVLFGVGSFRSPTFFVETTHAFRMQAQEGLALGALAITFSSALYPWMLRRKTSQKGVLGGVSWELHKCMGLLAMGVVLGGLSVINISLGVLIMAVWVPVMLLVRPTKSRPGNLLQYIVLLSVSPLGLLYISCTLHLWMFEKPAADPQELLMNAWTLLQKALLSSVIDASLLGNWMFSFVTLVLLPIWLMFWSLLWADCS